MAGNPWDDPSLASDETKKLRKKTQDLKLNPVSSAAPKAKPAGLSGLSDAYGQAEKLERRNKAVARATRGVRKLLPGQGE